VGQEHEIGVRLFSGHYAQSLLALEVFDSLLD
jgi:hypothetical protein